MTDIVKRLRENPLNLPAGFVGIQYEAADEIERLRSALTPFAELVDKPVNIYECKGVQLALIKFDDLSRLCRAAKAALESKNGRDR